MTLSEITYVSLEAEGPQVTPDDVEDLREAFSPLAPLRVWGAQAPAHMDAAMVGAAVGFFGAKLVDLLLSKAFDDLWTRLGGGWKQYRARRLQRGRREPTFDQLKLQAADCAVVVNGPPEPGSRLLQEVMALLGSRLRDGALATQDVALITLPCRRRAGEWEVSEQDAPSPRDSFYVWHIRPRTANGRWGFYDAREDSWIDQLSS